MTESAPLLDNFDENEPRIGEAPTEKTSASAYFRHLLKILAISALVISIVTMALLIAANIIARQKNWGNSASTPWRGQVKHTAKVLAILMSAPLVNSGLSALFVFPILFSVAVDAVILAYVIAILVEFILQIPNSEGCRQYRYPGWPAKPIPLPLDPKCLHWQSILTVLMVIVAGLTLLICIIYAVQLLFRGIAVYRTKLWKIPLSSVLPNEIEIHFRMRVLQATREGEGAEESGRGPVYLS